jgi:membrane protein YqaA with SNARE-associated domain
MTKSAPLSSELKHLIGRKFLMAALSLLGLGLCAAFLVIQLKDELDIATQIVFSTVGIGGVAALLFITDAFVSPFPPDSLLILISASRYHEIWPWLIPLLGLLSSVAGCVGYGCGLYFSKHDWAVAWFGKFRKKSEASIRRFGPWGVAIGALTPLPFSITCWGAGLLHVPFQSVWPSCLLRVPRYVVYYVVIAYSPQLFS